MASRDNCPSKIEAFPTYTVKAGDTTTIGPFNLEFFGGQHALIHSSIPRAINLGVMVNDLLYYPGDSFILPQKPVDTLAVPASAPWLKMSEAMDFLASVEPRFAFPTHDAMLSENGKAIHDRLFTQIADKHAIEYKRLSGPIEI